MKRCRVEWSFSSTHPVTAKRHLVKSAPESDWAPHPVRKLWRGVKYIPGIEPWIFWSSNQFTVLAVGTLNLPEVRRGDSNGFWMIQINQPTKCNSFTSLLLDVLCRTTCFGRLYAHHQELTTALTASGFTIGAWW